MGEVTNLASGGGVGSLNNCLHIFGLYYNDKGLFFFITSKSFCVTISESGFTRFKDFQDWMSLLAENCTHRITEIFIYGELYK